MTEQYESLPETNAFGGMCVSPDIPVFNELLTEVRYGDPGLPDALRFAHLSGDADTPIANGLVQDVVLGRVALGDNTLSETDLANGRKRESRLAVGAKDFPMFMLNPMRAKNSIIHVFHGSHERNQPANSIEVDQMVALGDNREFSKGEFVPYFEKSFVITVSSVQEDGTRQPRAMMRVTPYSPVDGLKTFGDIATLTGKTPEEVETEFIEQTGCPDMNGVWDITTLALAPDIESYRDKFALINELLGAVYSVAAAHIEAGSLTHIVSENDPHMHNALLKLGYPMQDINGYGDMHYDLDGSGIAMTCHPAYFTTADLTDGIRAARTPHLKQLQALRGTFE